MSGEKEGPVNQNYTEHFFKNITNHQQLDSVIVQGIIRCVQASGMRTTDEDILNHIQGDVVIVYQDDQTKEIFAFSSTSFISPNEHFGSTDISNELGCCLVGATVAKQRQGEGMYKKMNERRIGIGIERGLSLVFTQTQNRRVMNGIQAVLDMNIDKGLITGYELEKVLRPGHYGRMLTEDLPLQFPELDYEKGDAYTLLFHLQGMGDRSEI